MGHMGLGGFAHNLPGYLPRGMIPGSALEGSLAGYLTCMLPFTVGQGLYPAAGGGAALPAQPGHPPPGHKGTWAPAPQSLGRGR